MWVVCRVLLSICWAFALFSITTARVIMPYGSEPDGYGDYFRDDGIITHKRAPSAGDMMVRFG